MPRLTITEIAQHVGVHKSTVSRQARAHGLVGVDGKVDLDQYQALRAGGLDPALQTSGAAAIGGGDAESGLAAERLRKMAADAQLAELELGRQKGRLLDAERVEAVNQDLLSKLRDTLLLVGAEVAAPCVAAGDAVAVERIITAAIRRRLDDFSKELLGNAMGGSA